MSGVPWGDLSGPLEAAAKGENIIREALVTACTCRSRARSTAADGETPRRYIRESKGVKKPGEPGLP